MIVQDGAIWGERWHNERVISSKRDFSVFTMSIPAGIETNFNVSGREKEE